MILLTYDYLFQVDSGDRANFAKIVEAIKTNFNDRYDEIRRHWGGGILGSKSAARMSETERMDGRCGSGGASREKKEAKKSPAAVSVHLLNHGEAVFGLEVLSPPFFLAPSPPSSLTLFSLLFLSAARRNK